MRSALNAAAQRRAVRGRSSSLSAVPPAEDSDQYIPELAAAAASILYQSPLPSREGRPVYILNAAAFPDAYDVDYDSLLSYVLARLPGEDELIAGTEYEIVFFAGGQPDSATSEKKQGPNTGWYLQAYHVLSRATRKKLQRLYIVHPRTWVRVLISVFGTIVSPKFRRKIVHVNSLAALAQHLPVEKLLIPPSAYLQDRKVTSEIQLPYPTGTRAFGSRHALPRSLTSGSTRLPRILRETTTFVLMPQNVCVEGLFRIPPSSVLAGILKEAYDRGQQYIVWKERDMTFSQPNLPASLLREARLEDAYGVHLAASLIKAWYRDLREPLIPETAYAPLREKFQDTKAQVSVEDLTDLLLPASTVSPLTMKTREILIRHLLPLLSAVASHERYNKMNSENLAICFSMCLVCGSNQMEDGRMSPMIKRILQAAIEAWPQLRIGMGIDPEAFSRDIASPIEFRDYEDTQDDEALYTHHMRNLDEENAHRIIMSDSDSGRSSSPPVDEKSAVLPPKADEMPPALPPRRFRAASIKNALTPDLEKLHLDAIPALLKRKPAPPVPDSASKPAFTPPRSVVPEGSGRASSVADSAVSITPDFDSSTTQIRSVPNAHSEHNTVESHTAINAPALTLATNMPKRKAVSSAQITTHADALSGPTSVPTRVPPAPTALLAHMAAGQAAVALSQRLAAQPPDVTVSDADDLQSSPIEYTTDSPRSAPPLYRKASWSSSGSARPTEIHSLARPVHAQTLPVFASPHHTAALAETGAASIPRHRTLAPGLLKRMASMETMPVVAARPPTQDRSLEPRKLNLRKTSVDDLRRLYEERASTVGSLETAAGAAATRRSSAAV